MMIRWIGRYRMTAASALLVILLCGCTTLLNGDLTVAYLPEEGRAGIGSQEGVGAVINYRDSIFNPQVYDSEYPDAFYIPEKYSKMQEDIRGFELLDFVNGDTFVYAYQTMVYKDAGTASALVPVSGEYAFYGSSVTADTRELTGEMVTVLASNRYTAREAGEGYRELCCWVTEATDNQSFFAGAIGELRKETGGQDAVVGGYAVYFNGHGVVYQASEVMAALKNNGELKPLVEYQFSEVIQEITEEIVKEEGGDAREGQQYQFDITDVSFSAGKDQVDIYMLLTRSRITDQEELEKEAQIVSANLDASVPLDEDETIDESQYGMQSYNIHMGFYRMDNDFSCTIQNIRCGEQIECFRTNGGCGAADCEWDVSDNSVHFLTKEEVLSRRPSEYGAFFLENDAAARAFAHHEGTKVYDVCPSTEFVIDGCRITGRLRMTGQTSIEAVRRGYYTEDGRRVEADVCASFIDTRSFTLEAPMVVAYDWERQKEEGYARCFVMNGIRADYAVCLPEGESARIELTDVCWSGRNYEFSDWDKFLQWFTGQRKWDGQITAGPMPAINSITGRTIDGKAYLFCHVRKGIYVYGITPELTGEGWQFNINQSLYFDFRTLNVSAGSTQERDTASHTEDILQRYQETEFYRTGSDFKPLTVSDQAALQREYAVSDAAADVYRDSGINVIDGLWTGIMGRNQAWVFCTPEAGLAIIRNGGEAYIPVFHKNVIYDSDVETDEAAVSHYQQLTRLEQGVAAYAVFENQGEDRESYPFLLLGYDYQGAVYTAMDIARAKVIPFAIVEPGKGAADGTWNRLTPEPGESRVYYLKDCYDRSLYGTVGIMPGYKDG